MAKSPLPVIAEFSELSAEIALDNNSILKNIYSTIDVAAVGILTLNQSFDKFFDWNRENAASLAAAASLAGGDSGAKSVEKTAGAKGDSDSFKDSAKGLGKTLLIATIAAGTIAGALKGISALARTWSTVFTPGISKAFSDFSTGLVSRFAAIKEGFSTRFATTINSLSEVFDGSASRIKGFLGFGENSRLSSLMNTFSKRISRVTSSFSDIVAIIRTSITPAINGITDTFNTVKASFSKMGGGVRIVSSTVSKLFVPLAIILAAFDTIKGAIAGYAEDGIWGALEGGITGIFNSLIAMPLDLLKSGVAWILGKLGRENAEAALNSFSFATLFSDMFGSLFDGLKTVFSFITDLFSFGEGDMTALGLLGKLTDIIFAPMFTAINFITGMFGWSNPDEPFTMSGLIADAFNAVRTWLTGKLGFDPVDKLGEGVGFISNLVSDAWGSIKEWFFEKLGNIGDALPSIEDIKASLMSKLPSWMIPDRFKTPEMRATEIQGQIAEEQERISRSDAGVNEYVGFESSGRAKSVEAIAELTAALKDVQASSPTIITNNNITTDASTSNRSSSAVNLNNGPPGQGAPRPDR